MGIDLVSLAIAAAVAIGTIILQRRQGITPAPTPAPGPAPGPSPGPAPAPNPFPVVPSANPILDAILALLNQMKAGTPVAGVSAEFLHADGTCHHVNLGQATKPAP